MGKLSRSHFRVARITVPPLLDAGYDVSITETMASLASRVVAAHTLPVSSLLTNSKAMQRPCRHFDGHFPSPWHLASAAKKGSHPRDAIVMAFHSLVHSPSAYNRLKLRAYT